MSQPFPDQNEAFALIIDTSLSEVSQLENAWSMAESIYSLIGAEHFKIFTLGNTTPIPPTALKQSRPLDINQQARPCSLIAPIMEVLVQQKQKHSVIIVGSGKIFDLDDWIGDPRIDGWLLVLIGTQSLQGLNRQITEIKAEQIASLETDMLLDYFTRLPPQTAETARRTDDLGTYKWKIDSSGYPLVFVEPLEAYVHLFPVTKQQFERFITSRRQGGMDDKWYEEIDALNPRVSYRSLDIHTPERLFMTGVSTDEAQSFSRWLGRHYSLLSADDWKKCYDWFKEQQDQPAPFLPLNLAERLSTDAVAIWDIIEAQLLDQHKQINLWNLSLMKQGILEWVIELPGTYYGLGDPATVKSMRKFSDPLRLLGAEPRRHKNLGFRLRTR